MPRGLRFFVGSKDRGQSRHTPREYAPITGAMKREPFLRATVSALALVALLTPVCSFAQDAEADPEIPDASDQAELGNVGAAGAGEIVVTGSRLTTGFSAPTPVTVVGAEYLEQRAPANVADAINEAPQFKVSRSDTARGLTDSTQGVQNTLDLRALGDYRTLSLINGRRSVATTFLGTFDTNMIPIGLVERVEVVTGGASAAYGSDAVAGVVNFILRNHMEGLEVSLQQGITDYGDGRSITATLAGGTAFAGGRGHVVLGADYSKSEGIGSLYERPWGQQEVSTVSRGNRPATEPAGLVTTGVEPGTSAPGGLIQTPLSDGNLYAFDAAGNPYVFDRGTLYGTNMVGSSANYGYNSLLLSPIRVPTERAVVYGRAEYELTDSITAFAEANYGRTNVPRTEIGNYYSGGSASTPPLTISGDNPFIPASVRDLLTPAQQGSFTLGRINTELPYITEQASTLKRGVVGLSGDLGDGWDWEASYQEGRFSQHFVQGGFVPAALQKAVNSCSEAGLSAAQLSQVAAYESLSGKACVPFNPFGIGANSSAAVDYVNNDQTNVLKTGLRAAAASISGSPVTLWAGDLSVAAGLEYRDETLSTEPDALTSSATSFYSVGNMVPYSGERDVKEGFIEVGLPLLRDLPFARSVDLNGAVRRTDYSTSGPVTTWKLGGSWEVVDALRFRLTRSRDIRAPNLQELYFIGGSTPLDNISNLIPIGTVGADGTVNQRTGTSGNTLQSGAGNEALVPEIADTFTAGGVLSLGRFRASLDYYDIRVAGAIARLGSVSQITQCALGSTMACSAIVFDNSALGIGFVKNQSTNSQTLTVKGWDFEASYNWPQPLGLSGVFQSRALVNYAPRYRVFNPINNTTTEYAGVLSGTVAFYQPKLSGNITLNYSTDSFALGLQVRGFSELRGNPVIYDASGNIASATVLGPEDDGYSPTSPTSVSKNRYPGRIYFNPSVQFKVDDQVTLFANVDNLLNTAPPALTLTPDYDLVGRRYRIGIRAKVF